MQSNKSSNHGSDSEGISPRTGWWTLYNHQTLFEIYVFLNSPLPSSISGVFRKTGKTNKQGRQTQNDPNFDKPTVQIQRTHDESSTTSDTRITNFNPSCISLWPQISHKRKPVFKICARQNGLFSPFSVNSRALGVIPAIEVQHELNFMITKRSQAKICF